MADLSPYAGARAYGRAIDPALLDAVRASSQRLGINPSDLLTAMSYETGGRLDHNLWGGKNNNYLGLIQFGPQEQAKYGVKLGMPVADHVTAAENFLRDRGVRPGMGLLDIYSTINAGAPGLYNRSDAANGGAPGTVAEKVANQMAGHRARADALLGEPPRPPMPIPNAGPSIAGAYAQQPGQQMPLFAQPQPAGQAPSQAQSIWNFMFPQTAQSTTNLPLFTQDRQASDAADWAAQLLRG